MSLSREQTERYARNVILSEVGEAGQERLLAGSVLLVGVGGLGSPAALYLAAAGIGTLGLIDSDVVDISNLQRQIIHRTPDIGRAKVDSAAEKIEALNPDVTVRKYRKRLDPSNALQLLQDYDFIIDCTDNFDSKFLVADACHQARKPYCHAGILRFEGQLMTVIPAKTACYRCLFNRPPAAGAVPGGAQAGVMGLLPGVIGTLQATEAVKFILHRGELLTNRLMIYNALQGAFRTVKLERNPDCPLCGEPPGYGVSCG